MIRASLMECVQEADIWREGLQGVLKVEAVIREAIRAEQEQDEERLLQEHARYDVCVCSRIEALGTQVLRWVMIVAQFCRCAQSRMRAATRVT